MQMKVFQLQTFRIGAIISFFDILCTSLANSVIHFSTHFQIVIMFHHFLILCHHYCFHIIVCFLLCPCCQNEFIVQSFPPNRDIGDKYSIFQSLEALNLHSTGVCYNYPEPV